MHGSLVRAIACLLLIAVAPVVPRAEAAMRAKKQVKSRINEDKAYSLEDIMKSPREYLEREVFFYCRFASTANLFKNVNTRFNSTEHTNFAVWPDKTVLWDSKGRKNVLPTLYIYKIEADVLESLRTLRKYELIAVTGRVLNVYAGYPWLLVTKIERVELPSDRLTEPVVEHMQNGYDALSVNNGGVAARHFEQALQFGLPPEYCAKAHEQLARAYLLDNQLDKAQDYLRMAVEADPSDPILNLALADVSLKMGDADEAIAHCTFALERSGKHPQVYGIMGEAKSLKGDYVAAFADLNTAAGTPGITPREQAMVNVRRARVYVRAGRYPDAARAYAAVSEPGGPLANEGWLHNEVGLFYEKLYLINGDERYLDSAYSSYDEASRLNRLDGAVLYNLAEVEFRRQRLAGATEFAATREVLTRINQVQPEYTPARILEGRVLFAENKPEEAEYRYQSVAGQITGDAMAMMALAEAYADLGKTAEAAAAVSHARQLQPWNERIRALGDYLAESHAQLAQPVEQPVERQQPQYVQPDGQPTGYYVDPAGSYDKYQAIQPTGGRVITIQPGDIIRVGQNGVIMAEPGPAAGVDIQTSVAPSVVVQPGVAPNANVQPGAVPEASAFRPAPAYPVTEVKIPERQAAIKPAPINLGYNTGSGATFAVGSAYASMSPLSENPLGAPAADEPVMPQPLFLGESGTDLVGQATGMPAPFDFNPGLSPVIIPEYVSPVDMASAMPARNVNLYKRAGGSRQPAEIIEKESVLPRQTIPDDTLVMVAPQETEASSGIHRTEVRLPSTAQGIGMSSDYATLY